MAEEVLPDLRRRDTPPGARTTGRRLTFPILQTIAVPDGRIVAVGPFSWDTAAMVEACVGEQRVVACPHARIRSVA